MLLRKTLLTLSQQHAVRDALLARPTARRAARRFIAGETLDDALAAIRRLNARGIRASLDHLGEEVTNAAGARRAADDCLAAIEAIRQTGVDANVSIKLTQLGLACGDEVGRANLIRILDAAATAGTFVRVDMEGSPFTQRTLDLVRAVRPDRSNVGVVIQAYLYRSGDDVRALNALGVRVRLCKGAYNEPPAIAYPAKPAVDANFRNLLERLLLDGTDPAIATHDEALIAHTKAFARAHGIGPDRFEFQMLYGIWRDLQAQLVAEGYRLRVYVPYGEEWHPYFMRRLAERPANVLFLLRNVLADR